MKSNPMIGLILIALGIVALAYQGITYTTRHKAVDLGPIEVTTERTKTIPLPPVVGGLALIGGIVMLAGSSKRA